MKILASALSVLEFWKSDLELPDFVTIIPSSTKIDQVKKHEEYTFL